MDAWEAPDHAIPPCRYDWPGRAMTGLEPVYRTVIVDDHELLRAGTRGIGPGGRR